MAVTYGFYDSLNHDRLYNAQQMSAIFDGIINDGVFMSVGNQFHTVAGTGMQVIVKSGRAWFDSTWTLNDAEYPLSIDAADVLLTRIDAVVLEVNSEVATRANTIKVVKGTPASTPAKPTLTNTATIHQHALAYVTVAKNTTAITNSMIEIVVGKTETPYVTAILQTTDITDLYNQWEDYFQTWFDNVRSTLDGDVALNLQNQITTLERSILKADTKTAMGLPSSAIGDDAFNYLLTQQNKSYDIPYYPKLVVIQESSNFTIPTNINQKYIDVIAIGGGGGAGGSYRYDSTSYNANGGGGGGGYVIEKRIAVNPNETIKIEIGAGGISGEYASKPTDTMDGTAGGNTIVRRSNNELILTAMGGSPGTRVTQSGYGGNGGNGGSGGGGGGGGIQGGNGGIGYDGGGGGGGGATASGTPGHGGSGKYGGGGNGSTVSYSGNTGELGGNGGSANNPAQNGSYVNIYSSVLDYFVGHSKGFMEYFLSKAGTTYESDTYGFGGGGGYASNGGNGGSGDSNRGIYGPGGGGGGYYSSGYRGANPNSSRWDGTNGGGGGNHYQLVPIKYGTETYSDLNYTISGGRGLQCIINDTVYEFGHGGSAWPYIENDGSAKRITHGVVIIIVYLKKETTT